MHLSLNTVTPRGATASCHRIHSTEIKGEAVHVMVNSYASSSQELPVWQDTHIMPLITYREGIYPDNVFHWLTGPTGYFNGAIQVEDASALESLKATMLANVNTLRDQTIHSGAQTPVGIVDTDEVSIRNIMGSYQAASLAMMTQNPFAISWRMSDDSNAELDAIGMIAIGNAVLANTQAAYTRSWELKREIEVAETAEALDAINLRTGWTTA